VPTGHAAGSAPTDAINTETSLKYTRASSRLHCRSSAAAAAAPAAAAAAADVTAGE